MSSRQENALEAPQAGPSRILPRLHTQDVHSEDDEDTDVTPKILKKPQLESVGGSARSSLPDPNLNAEHPTLRLRAILAHNKSNAGNVSRSQMPPTPSDVESDFEIPNITATSLARESLSAIFSRALRSPGDTPRKSSDRQRRNSIDVSEVEDSPRMLTVMKERARIKGKRQSMSDEEAEKLAKSVQESERSLRSSAAATFDALRERLQSSVTTPRPPPAAPSTEPPTHSGFSLQEFINSQRAEDDSQSDMELSDGPAEESGETATLARHMNTMATPDATSTSMLTSMRTLQLPSRIQMQSNLMEQDSDMQNMMQALDSSYDRPSSEDADRGAEQRTVPFQPSRPSRPPPSLNEMDKTLTSMPFPSSSGDSQPAPSFPKSDVVFPPRAHNKSHSSHGLPVARRVSGDLDTRRLSGGSFGGTSSRSSSISATDLSDRTRESDRDKLHERERLWNKPTTSGRSPGHTSTPPHSRPSSYTTRGGSPHTLTRRVSSASIDGRSSVASSIGSRADYRDQVKETEAENSRERERLWNRSQPRRSSSSMSHNSPGNRPRRSSIPTRPDSAQSYTTPPRSNSRPSSWNSALSTSPTPAMWQSMSREEREAWIEKERERNWGNPHPRWEIAPPRPMSPLPPGPDPGPSPYTYKGLPKDSPLHPDNRSQRKFVIPSYGSPSPRRTRERVASSGSPAKEEGKERERERAHSLSEHPSTRLYRPLMRAGTDSKIPRPTTPSSQSPSQLPQEEAHAQDQAEEPGKGKARAGSNTSPFSSRFGWSFAKNRSTISLRPVESEEDDDIEDEAERSASKIPAPAFGPAKHQVPLRASAKELRDRMMAMQEEPLIEESEWKRGHRRSTTEFSESTGQERHRAPVEPVEVSTSTEQEGEVPTDIETESDTASAVTKTPTPLARPTQLPPPEPELPQTPPRSNPSTPPSNSPTREESVGSEQFYSMTTNAKPPSPPSTPPDEHSTTEMSYISEMSYTLQTPPRHSQRNSSNLEFESPSPPQDLPELPPPPPLSSEEEEEEEMNEDVTPLNNPFANLSSIKTPKPPGGWELTPVSAEKSAHSKRPAASQAVEDTPISPASVQASQSTVAPTPVPPGAWLPTPAGSTRRKSILKVRFDVDGNTSADSLASVPMVGPSDSISDIFPPVDPAASKKTAKAEADEEERPITPPTIRARKEPRSPGVRLVDAFGREVTAEEQTKAGAVLEHSVKKAEKAGKAERADKKASAADRKALGSTTTSGTTTTRPRGAVRIVDAMGREVTEVSTEESEPSESLDVPISHSEALARMKKTVSSLVEDLGDSDTSRELAPRGDHRLRELYEASNAARAARKNIKESLQKYKSTEDELKAKYGSLREGMNRSKLLTPVVSPHKYSVNLFNTWVLWTLLIFQVIVLIYMYHLSTIRAKHIFLTTYYDAFHPDLFLHLTTHRTVQNAPSWSLTAISNTIHRIGWRGMASEVLGNITSLASEVRSSLWETWGQQRTTVWPPT